MFRWMAPLIAAVGLAWVGIAAEARAEGSEHLQPLAWMVGEWNGKAGEGHILLSTEWCDDGHFLLREFLVVGPDGERVGGTQRIGWDPIKKQIKSWSFDSQGGTGEGYWRQDGDRWIVDSKEVTADGRELNLSAVYTPKDPDAFVFDVSHAAEVADKLPATRIEFTRAKAEDKQ